MEKVSCQPATSAWKNEDINGFYRQYVEPCLAPLGPAWPAIEWILKLLDEHGDCPSSIVESKIAEPDSEKEHIFAEISLREYSLEVARVALNMIKKAHKDYEMIAGKILVVTLGHQLGIMSDAGALGGIPAKSILMLDPLIRDLPYRQSVITAIRTFRTNNPKTDEARILKAASSAARKNEHERAEVFSKVWQRPSMDIMDIEKIKSIIESSESSGQVSGKENED